MRCVGICALGMGCFVGLLLKFGCPYMWFGVGICAGCCILLGWFACCLVSVLRL